MSHFHNVTPRQLTGGMLILGVVLVVLFAVTSSLSLTAAGGMLFIVSHLVLASGVLIWGIGRLVRFVRQLHQPQS